MVSQTLAGGRITHPPGFGFTGLMLTCQSRHNPTHEPFIILYGESPVHIHDLIVPRWHLTVRLVLAGIPVGRDVALIATKYHHHIRTIAALLPDRIGAGHVRGEQSSGGIQFKRDMVGVKTFRCRTDQYPERMRLNDSMQCRKVLDRKVVGDTGTGAGMSDMPQ